MCIKQALKRWDGKSADVINQVYERYSQQPAFLSELIVLIKHIPTQKGATWLLKKYVEIHGDITPALAKEVYQQLKLLAGWEAKLHVLQCIAYMPIQKTQKKNVEVFVRTCLADKNKFLRAWAYNGFYELAIQHTAYQEEARDFLNMAMRDESASIKARVRKIMKKGFS